MVSVIMMSNGGACVDKYLLLLVLQSKLPLVSVCSPAVLVLSQRSATVGPASMKTKAKTVLGSGLKKDPVVSVLYQHTGR
jgi:hypothetical protein